MKYFFTLSLSVIALSACDHHRQRNFSHADYWQRSESSSALHLRGPKAQQILHQDIARCTNELRELDRLGSLRRAIPADNDGHIAGSPEAKLAEWETPKRDGYLYAEHLDYHDFETCMIAHGWERTAFVPFDVIENAQEVYNKTLYGPSHHHQQSGKSSSQNFNLNE